MQDPYATLGVPKTATEKEIRDAFKKLTRKFHPDLHPGDAAAEEKFKQISIANDLLGDPDKRRRFDAGEIDASGAERPRQPFYRDFAEAPPRGGHAARDGFDADADLRDFFSQAFGGTGGFGGRGGARADFSAKGQDMSYALPVDFLDAVNGAKRAITLPDGKVLNVTIPEGAEDRQMLRLRGQGGPGFNGGAAGDAYVELHIEPHAFFRRKDNDILVEVPVTLSEAVLGAKIEVPTIGGPVTLTVPRGSNTGRVLRLRDKGVLDRRSKQRGHQLVTLKVTLPTGEEPELTAFLEGWTPVTPEPAQGDVAMMRAEELLATITTLRRTDLEIWIREKFVTASRQSDTYLFSDRDCARVRLLCTLRYEMEIEIDTLPVVLSLIDQLYDTRRQLRALGAAVAAEDAATRAAILARLAPAELEDQRG